jgi:hypothetical protein
VRNLQSPLGGAILSKELALSVMFHIAAYAVLFVA